MASKRLPRTGTPESATSTSTRSSPPPRVLPTTGPLPAQRPAPASTALAGLFDDNTDDKDDDPKQEQRAAFLSGDASTDAPVTPFEGEL
ncbi:hypothetical protein ACFZCK_22710 [Kitasatospora purpeofusca]|uniref:hypothetical protein n=1 Tax=Kitasatospora purpeofusca TaxID=67352 RepID=UPI0036F03C87